MASRTLTIIAVTGLDNQPISELMLQVAERNTHPAAAEAAFTEIVRRYRGYLYTVCHNFLTGRICDTIRVPVEDLLNIVLSKIWEHADTFDEPGGLTPEEQEKCFLGWCGQIANNAGFDELSKIDQEEVRDDLFWQNWKPVPWARLPSSNPVLMEAYQEAFEQLPTKSREVLLVTAYFMRPGARHHRIPPEENTALAARLGVTTASLRKIRERAYKFIRDFIQSKGIQIQRNPSQ